MGTFLRHSVVHSLTDICQNVAKDDLQVQKLSIKVTCFIYVMQLHTVSVLGFFQCSDTAGWMDGRNGIRCVRTVILKCSLLEQRE